MTDPRCRPYLVEPLPPDMSSDIEKSAPTPCCRPLRPDGAQLAWRSPTAAAGEQQRHADCAQTRHKVAEESAAVPQRVEESASRCRGAGSEIVDEALACGRGDRFRRTSAIVRCGRRRRHRHKSKVPRGRRPGLDLPLPKSCRRIGIAGRNRLAVMRDVATTCRLLFVANIDQMGVHTGDSDRGAGADAHRHGVQRCATRRGASSGASVEPGGSNIHVCESSETAESSARDEPRVSRSSALASKATGFPMPERGKAGLGYPLTRSPTSRVSRPRHSSRPSTTSSSSSRGGISRSFRRRIAR